MTPSPAACPLRHVPPSPSASVLKQHRAVCSAVHGNRPGPLIGRGKRKKSERRTGPRLAVSDASGVASGGQDDAGIRGFRSALTRASHPISSHHTPALSLVSLGLTLPLPFLCFRSVFLLRCCCCCCGGGLNPLSSASCHRSTRI
jgi:hypothetical protein